MPDPAAPPPSQAYADALARRTAELAAAAQPPSSPHRGAGGNLRGAGEEAVRAVGHDAVALSHDLHAHPEEAFAEYRSVTAVADTLRAHGLAAQTGVHGLPTALRAVTGSGQAPRLAVLAEFDALPGLGHACGHNVICGAAVGAFLALHRVLARDDTPAGTAVLLCTPAEEGGGGKELMARDGAFDGLDAVLMLHPFSHDIADHPFLGRRQLEVTYHGVAAHAAAQPFMGRNALDAVVLGYQGVAMLRQHIPPPDRVHGVILDGGQRPNVVPDRAVARYYLRSPEPDTLRDLTTRVEAIAVAAAAMAGCGYELDWDPRPGYLPIRHNRTLGARYAGHLGRCGRAVLPRGVVDESLTGSTDLGNVSVRVPAIHPMIAISDPGVMLHTPGFAEAAASGRADVAVRDGAAGLALTALDFLADADLRTAVADEFAAAGGVLDVARFFDAGQP
ncbi:MAG: amidohydrolase [Pseudonocardiaceae bacterium]|nr:amidohydrolase [Pseudonocardiaceae bacterium]